MTTDVCVGVCVCVRARARVRARVRVRVCVSQNNQAFNKTQTLDSCFSLVGPHQQGAELC